jgi:hypothetical protein
VGQLADSRNTVAFGTCGDCRHFSGGGATGYCACVAAELAPTDLGRLCINFAASEDRTLALHGAVTRKTA